MAIDIDATDDSLADELPALSDETEVCARGRRKMVELSGLGGGAMFVLVPNSELVHSLLRAVLGVGGYECC